MWVRTQDKKIITKTKKIECYVFREEYRISTDDLLLGSYSTEKEAMIVMDKVSAHIDSSYHSDVFQMPKINFSTVRRL